jgi:hypothetical protein
MKLALHFSYFGIAAQSKINLTRQPGQILDDDEQHWHQRMILDI